MTTFRFALCGCAMLMGIVAGCHSEPAPVDSQSIVEISQIIDETLPTEAKLIAHPIDGEGRAKAWLLQTNKRIEIRKRGKAEKSKRLPASILVGRIEQLAREKQGIRPATPFCDYTEWSRDQQINRLWQMEADGAWYVFLESIVDD